MDFVNPVEARPLRTANKAQHTHNAHTADMEIQKGASMRDASIVACHTADNGE